MLVVSTKVADRWSHARFSPFGCVEKSGVDLMNDARVIHDLSFPLGQSVNSTSSRDLLPSITYEPVACVAQRIEEVSNRWPSVSIAMLKGDVSRAFQNIPLAAEICHQFCGHIPASLADVIWVALLFGWTASPAHYGVFGGAISHLVRMESPNSLCPSNPDTNAFFACEWVDDRVLIKPSLSGRLEGA
ncbi:TPA: hypothetical protein N0F65_011819 [Lagenidium giganteum]|uniref:Reverse transcriptase domain-containing protein n=1 Tax=Lagenidium giganteum TaxID=4803 RepID=A0AAV2Z2B0_9STRA|nr:TPA: hypothetical protein N0F65_011819 [Lagenidium giganteum]